MNLSQLRYTLSRWLTQPLLGILSKTRLSPNALTVVGFLLSLGAAALIACGELFYGGVIVLLSGVFDLLDGAVARAQKKTTPFGALLDSTLDRCSEAALLFGLLVLYIEIGVPLGVWLVYITLVGSMLVSYIRARAEGLGLDCKVGWFTRAERVVVLALGLLLNQVLIALWILAVFAYLTVIQRLLYIWQRTRGGDRCQ